MNGFRLSGSVVQPILSTGPAEGLLDGEVDAIAFVRPTARPAARIATTIAMSGRCIGVRLLLMISP